MTTDKTRHFTLRDNTAAQRVLTEEAPFSYAALPADTDILLAGGFTSLAAEAPYPFSAALQLNGDCTSMDIDSLKQFAEAELEKHRRISYRSYDIDPDFRVCAISDDPAKLADFIETYGGILEIEPLLTARSHPEYSRVVELEVAAQTKGYRIQYSVRSPIAHSRCTYCGICGTMCPEQCISETLFFDFDRCTFCLECQKACPVEAIDMHSVERISLNIPALIILGRPQLELPPDSPAIYRESEVSRYLATLFSCRVDEVITCNHQLCHYNGESQTGCTACLGVCRYGAVKTASGEIKIDSLSCTECGNCVSVCPTGALQYHKFSDQAFIEFFRTFHLVKDTAVIIGSKTDLHRFWWLHNQARFERAWFFEYPTSGGLSPMHLLFLLAHGAGRIIVLSKDTGADSPLYLSIREINLILDRIFVCGDVVQLCRPETFTDDPLQNEVKLSPAKVYTDLNYINRREKLSAQVQFVAGQASDNVALETDEVRFFATIICAEERCTQCLACLNACNIESLSADPASLSLRWLGSLCIGCGGCVTTCPEQALSVVNSATLSGAFFSATQIAMAEPMRCKECGKVFGTKKSFERVIKLLAERLQTPPDHLEYCEDCRVLKLLESQ